MTINSGPDATGRPRLVAFLRIGAWPALISSASRAAPILNDVRLRQTLPVDLQKFNHGLTAKCRALCQITGTSHPQERHA